MRCETAIGLDKHVCYHARISFNQAKKRKYPSDLLKCISRIAIVAYYPACKFSLDFFPKKVLLSV